YWSRLCSLLLSMLFFFFFSSRRRHTRFSRDWSSDVCSSDLDYVLMEKALEEGKEIIGLETSASQIEALSSPSDSAGVLYLEKTRSEERRVGKECRSRWWA